MWEGSATVFSALPMGSTYSECFPERRQCELRCEQGNWRNGRYSVGALEDFTDRSIFLPGCASPAFRPMTSSFVTADKRSERFVATRCA
jgi:hypothetical protein